MRFRWRLTPHTCARRRLTSSRAIPLVVEDDIFMLLDGPNADIDWADEDEVLPDGLSLNEAFIHALRDLRLSR